MENDFYRDELEAFLQQKADEYAMYPSDKVWKGVKKNLFWQKNWFTVTASLFVFCLLFFVPDSFFTTLFNNNTTTRKQSGKADAPASVPFYRQLGPANQTSALLPPVSASNNLNTLTAISGKGNSLLPHTKPGMQIVNTSSHSSSILNPALVDVTNKTVAAGVDVSVPSLPEDPEVQIVEPSTEKSDVTAQPSEPILQYHGDLNFLQELAVIRLMPKKQSRFNLQFSFSPLVSYRTLTDNDHNTHTIQGNTPVNASPVDINRFVDHQPSIGVEVGSSILYKATKNITVKTGLQLNYSRYIIKAYRVGYQKASIALNTPGHVADTMTSYTTIRNFDGYTPEQLQNQYLQLSLPVGAEFKLLGSKRFQINIAGSIQPTLLLLNDSYLLSTDYINYTKEPSLVRNWNVHSSAEAYVSYQFANVRWQVGPQFRYQLLSSYNDRYPIKEYLMEYGIKFGISKTLR